MLLGEATPPAPAPGELPASAPAAAVKVDRDSKQIGAALVSVGAVALLGPRRSLAVAAIVAGAAVWKLGRLKAEQIVRKQWEELRK